MTLGTHLAFASVLYLGGATLFGYPPDAIGWALAEQYCAAGARVLATARSAADLQRLAALGARTLRLDVADAAGSSGLAWAVDGEAFDVVIVNAGIYGPDRAAFDVPTEAEFDTVMRTNVLGAMRVLAQVESDHASVEEMERMLGTMPQLGEREPLAPRLRAPIAATAAITPRPTRS